MNQKQKAEAFDALMLVEKFNKQYPVGSKVNYRVLHDKAPYKEVTVRSPAFVSRSHQPAAFFEELSGYYIISENFVQYK